MDYRKDQAADGVGAAMRNQYSRHPGGAEGWFREFGGQYTNPHEDAVADAVQRLVRSGWMAPGHRVLDLACGSGEVYRTLQGKGFAAEDLTACDPFTQAAFERRTGFVCRTDSFADVAAGSLSEFSFDRVVCAYALHLCEPSRLPAVCLALAMCAPELCVITPHKRPEIAPAWGWQLRKEEYDQGFRIRTRRYTRVAVTG